MLKPWSMRKDGVRYRGRKRKGGINWPACKMFVTTVMPFPPLALSSNFCMAHITTVPGKLGLSVTNKTVVSPAIFKLFGRTRKCSLLCKTPSPTPQVLEVKLVSTVVSPKPFDQEGFKNLRRPRTSKTSQVRFWTGGETKARSELETNLELSNFLQKPPYISRRVSRHQQQYFENPENLSNDTSDRNKRDN